MNQSASMIDDAASVSLRAVRSARIDMARAIEALTNLDWLGAQVDGPIGRDDLRRVRADLELAIRDGSAGGPIRKAALIDIGDAHALAGGLLVEIGWQSASLAPLFPVLAGQVRITAVGLVLDGRYAPPFGRLGLLIDAGILRFAARRTADAFLARLANQMSA